MPKVTVLMSVYNGVWYLREAIDSILRQTFTDFEFLIINDCSTDATQQIISSYSDPRIRVVVNDHNQGLTRSLNIGLSLAQGEYIARQDADDISCPARLAKQVIFLQGADHVGLVGTSYAVIDKLGRTLTTVQLPIENVSIKKRLPEENLFCHGSVMFKRQCLERVGTYREQFKYAQDYDFWLRIAAAFGVANLAEPLYKWRLLVNSASLSHSQQQLAYAQMAREANRTGRPVVALTRTEEYLPDRRLNKQKLIQDYLHWSWLFFEARNYPDSFRVLGKSFYYAPFAWKIWKRALKSLFLLVRRLNNPHGTCFVK